MQYANCHIIRTLLVELRLIPILLSQNRFGFLLPTLARAHRSVHAVLGASTAPQDENGQGWPPAARAKRLFALCLPCTAASGLLRRASCATRLPRALYHAPAAPYLVPVMRSMRSMHLGPAALAAAGVPLRCCLRLFYEPRARLPPPALFCFGLADLP